MQLKEITQRSPILGLVFPMQNCRIVLRSGIDIDVIDWLYLDFL